MKKQLYDCMRGRNKKYGYIIILVVFFFVRIPTLILVVTLPPSTLGDPRLMWWGDIFLLQGGGEVHNGDGDDFYSWCSRKVPTLEQFPYAGLTSMAILNSLSLLGSMGRYG